MLQEKIYIKQRNTIWLQILDHSYRTLIIEGSGFWKTNSLFNLISHKPEIDKFIYMLKIHMKKNINFIVDKLNSAGLKHFNDSKTFIKYSNDMNDIYKNIEEYSSNKKREIRFAFDDMVADMLSNKKLNSIVTE